MSVANSLESVIRIASPKESAEDDSSQIFAVDCSKTPGVILKSVPWISKITGKDVKYFLVSNTNDKRNEAICEGLSHRISDFVRRVNVDLIIRYRVSCLPENSETAAIAFSEGSQPEQMLTNLISLWIREYTFEREADFIDNFSEERIGLENHLRKKAMEHAGLTLHPIISLKEDEKIKPVRIRNFHIPIRVSDYSRDLNLMINLKTEVDESNKQKAIMSRVAESQLRMEIKERIQDVTVKTVTLENFYYELNTNVNRSLRKALAPLIEQEGKKIKDFWLDSQDEPPIQRDHSETIEFSFEEVVGETVKGKVKINTKMILSLNSRMICRYMQASPPHPKLSFWAKENTIKIFKKMFFHKRYEELVEFKDLKEKFIEKIQISADGIGFKAEVVSVSREFPDLKGKRRYEDNIDMVLNLLEYSDSIIAKNKFRMVMTAPQVYMARNSPSLKEWLKENLREVFNDILFKITYSKYVVRHKIFDKPIRDEMKKRAREIGYDLEQLIIQPQLECYTWQHPFSVTYSGEFTTKVGNKVPLKIVVYLYIPDLSKIGQYLTAKIDDEIEKVIRDVAQRILIGVDPYDFYMNFDESVVTTLQSSIGSALEKRFHANIENVIPQMIKEDDDVIKRLDELMYSFGELDFEVSPLGGGEKLHFKSQYQVRGVLSSFEAWEAFIKKKKLNLSEISNRVQKNIVSKLKILPPQVVEGKNPHHLDKLRSKIESLARESAVQLFGLDITLSATMRERTDLDQMTADVQIHEKQIALKIREAEIKKLEQDIARVKTISDSLNLIDQKKSDADVYRLERLEAEITESTVRNEPQQDIEKLKKERDEILDRYIQMSEDEKQRILRDNIPMLENKENVQVGGFLDLLSMHTQESESGPSHESARNPNVESKKRAQEKKDADDER